jgi:hypothetical protein
MVLISFLSLLKKTVRNIKGTELGVPPPIKTVFISGYSSCFKKYPVSSSILLRTCCISESDDNSQE